MMSIILAIMILCLIIVIVLLQNKNAKISAGLSGKMSDLYWKNEEIDRLKRLVKRNGEIVAPGKITKYEACYNGFDFSKITIALEKHNFNFKCMDTVTIVPWFHPIPKIVDAGLEVIDKNHSIDAIEDDEGKDEVKL